MYATFAALGRRTTAPPSLPRRTRSNPSASRIRIASRSDGLLTGKLEEQCVLFRKDAAVGEFAEEDAPSQLVSDLLGETAKLNRWLCHVPGLYRASK